MSNKLVFVINEEQAQVLDDISIVNSVRAIAHSMHNKGASKSLITFLESLELSIMDEAETPKTLEEYLNGNNND